MKERMKKMKLAPKLALAIGIALTVVFVVLITMTISLAQKVITSSTYGELEAISEKNSLEIQQIFDAADTVATSMQDYMERSYNKAAADPSLLAFPTEPEAIAMCLSTIYDGVVLSSIKYDEEIYLSETANTTVLNNTDIFGAGVMFEEYAFQSDVRDYAFYINESTANDPIQPYAPYSEYSQEAFYSRALQAKKAVITDPYDFNGVTMVTYSAPIMHGDTVQGIAMADIKVDNFSKVDATDEDYPSMYATIYNSAETIIYDSEDPADVGKSLAYYTPNQDELASMRESFAKGEAFRIETTREDGRRVVRFFSPIQAGSETWWSLTALNESDVNAAVNSTIRWMVILAAVALVIIILLLITLLRKMLRPMDAVIAAAEQISGGKLDVHLQAETEDEIGMLSRSFQTMSESLKIIVDDVQYLLGEMAEGNFDILTRAEEHYIGDYAEFLTSMRKLNRRLSATLLQINESADQVSNGSDQVSNGAQALSQGTTEQASSAEELAATVNEISAHVHKTAQNAEQARTQTNAAGDAIQHSNQQMQEMIVAMDEINQKSGEISKIIKTIEDIAFQTNILALNAAVEAARAGDAGKGFAVVADEVRNLASKSAEASKNTSTLIAGTVDAVDRGTKIANETAEYLQDVVQKAQAASEIVGEIAEAAEEQASSIAQITQGIDQISSVIQTNSATAEESAAASEELSGQAQLLKSLVSRFKIKRDTKAVVQTQPGNGQTNTNTLPTDAGKY